MIHLAALTGGLNVPSARFRIRQYIPYLVQQGIATTEFFSFFGSYPPRASFLLRFFWGQLSLLQRVPQIFATHKFQITFLQRELLSTFRTLERFTNRPRVLDVDDAIWLNRNGLGPKLAHTCDGIVCGNTFLADQFSNWHKRIYILPTAVDSVRFRPLGMRSKNQERIIVVWSGSNSGFPFLYSIEHALKKVLSQDKKIRLRIIADTKPNFTEIRDDSVEFLEWNPDTEVCGIQSADIGIMPLWNDAWSRGKCSFKMLTYMACGLPVVVSPVGMNGEILANGDLGFGPKNEKQWIDALVCLIDNAGIRSMMGNNGRKIIENKYSINVVVPRLAGIIRSFL